MTKNDQIISIVRAGNHPKFLNSPTPGCGLKAGSSPGTGMQEALVQGHLHQEAFNLHIYTVLGVIKDS